jgi:hypothetical protein
MTAYCNARPDDVTACAPLLRPVTWLAKVELALRAGRLATRGGRRGKTSPMSSATVCADCTPPHANHDLQRLADAMQR